MKYSIVPIIIFLFLMPACTEIKEDVSYKELGIKPEYSQYILYDKGIQFLGYDMDKNKLIAGNEAKVKYYWRTLEKIKRNYVIFVHFEFNGDNVFFGDHLPSKGEKMTSHWNEKEVIHDESIIKIPEDVIPGEYNIWIGIWDPDGSRKRLKVKKTELTNKDRRVLIGKVNIMPAKEIPEEKKLTLPLERLPEDFFGRIVFQSDRAGGSKIFILDHKGIRQVTFGNGNDFKPLFSSDGNKILFFSDRGGNTEIYTVNTDGSDLKRLTDHTSKDECPAWSPDGKKIIFESKREGATNLFIMDLENGNLRNLTRYSWGTAGIPSWSPSGDKIAFTSNRGFGWQVSIIDIDGNNERRLTSESGSCRPAFSPDGKMIAFVTQRSDGKGDIWVMGSDGSNQRRLTMDSENYDYYPAWSPDGNRIVYSSSHKKSEWKLFIMNADGTNPRQITYGKFSDAFPHWHN